jgi:hypothetical protein
MFLRSIPAVCLHIFFSHPLFLIFSAKKEKQRTIQVMAIHGVPKLERRMHIFCKSNGTVTCPTVDGIGM